MLSPADHDIVARDGALPGLELILDAETLATRLGLPRLATTYLRYKPGASCVAGFLAGWGTNGDQPFAAITYPRERYVSIRRRTGWQSGREPVRFLDDVCVAIVPMAHDRKLKALHRFADPTHRAKYLGRLIGDFAQDREILTTIRYKPGRRMVGRLDRDGRPRAVVKTYAVDEFAAALIGATNAANLDGAPLLGIDARRYSLAIGWIDGRQLCATQSEGHNDFWQTGAWLARFHLTRNSLRSSHASAKESNGLSAIVAALKALSPDLGAAAALLADAISIELERAPHTTGPTHGDFSADQVILRNDVPVVIDWDRATVGDQGCDIGVFLARLRAQNIDGLVTRANAEAYQSAFLDGYRATAGGLPDSYRAQYARALLGLAIEGFRLRLPDWIDRARYLFGCVDDVLAKPTRGRKQPPDAAMPTLATALDRKAMQRRLTRSLNVTAALFDVTEADLVRHKRGRRALIRYRIEVDRDCDNRSLELVGKLRAKGPDRRTPALHEALRAEGIDGRAPHRVGVPACRGCIEDLRLWLQEAVPGSVVTHFLKPGRPTDAARRAGAVLSLLHRTPVEIDRHWTVENEIGVLDGALTKARSRLPDQSDRIEAIRKKARDVAAKLSPTALTGIHRDFYSDQVLIDGENSWLLDLDLYAWGDPAIDLGNFLAHITELALRRYADADGLADHESAFLEGYHDGGVSPDSVHVAAFRAISLARHIHISTQFDDRHHTTLRLIDLCQAALANVSDRKREAPILPALDHCHRRPVVIANWNGRG